MQAALNPSRVLTERERGAMLACLDDYQPHQFITTALHHLDIFMPRVLLMPALEWLQRNKLTGKRLADFILGDCDASNVEFQRRLTAALLKEKETRLIAGKNFVV